MTRYTLRRPTFQGAPTHAHYNGPDGRLLDVALVAFDKAHGPLPAVLTDGRDWYSAELEPGGTDGGMIAYAINGYADRATAEIDAESRLSEYGD